MRRQWIILLGVLFVGIAAATATSIYLVHSDLATLSREVTSLGERVSAVEERLPPPPSIAGLAHIPGGLAPGASAVPLHMPTLMPPTPSSGSLVSEPLARELGLTREQTAEINRLISSFLIDEVTHLAPTTATASVQVGVAIRPGESYRREREERWRQFLAREIAPNLTREQMDQLSRRLSPGTADTTEAAPIRW